MEQEKDARAQPHSPDSSGDERRTPRPRRSVSKNDDATLGLVDLTSDAWSALLETQRMELLGQLSERYQQYLAELGESANLCVDRYQQFARSNKAWRIRIIVGTGVVAIVNLLATNASWSRHTYDVLPIIAAILAITLTILANLESFLNPPEKMQAYRESREMFLDAARDFERAWNVYVRPFSGEVQAWTNAVELYRRIVIRDRELRGVFRDLTRPSPGVAKRS
jgi:hypothetical protein